MYQIINRNARKQISRLFTQKAFLTLNNKLSARKSNTPALALKVTALGIIGSACAYHFLTGNAPMIEPSDPLFKFAPLNYSTVNTLLREHQQTISVPVRASAKGSALVRYDTSSINSNTPSEDRHTENEANGKYIFGVYDGHSGSDCVSIVSQYLPAYVSQAISIERPLSEISIALKQAFISLDKDILGGAFDTFSDSATLAFDKLMLSFKPALSGSCALMTVIDDDTIHVAWSGDSRAVLGRRNKLTGKYEAMALSVDHTTKNPREYERLIEEHPGELETVVIRGRVLGGLMPTRAFGDSKYKYDGVTQKRIFPYFGKRGPPPHLITPPYVTAEPEVFQLSRKELGDFFIVMATDGLYDMMDDDDVVSLVAGYIESKEVYFNPSDF